MIKKEGLLSFYRGSAPPLYSSLVFSSYYLWIYGNAKWFILGSGVQTRSPTVAQMSTIGFVSGFFSSFLNSPVELIKCKLQSSKSKQYTNTIQCTKAIVSQHGIQGLYQGFVPTLLRNCIGDMFYYGVYEISKYRLIKSIGDFWGILLAGGLGGISYWTSIYPLDVIKSKLQSQSYSPSERLYRGIIDCASKIWRTEGWRGFWKGYSVCLFRSFPTNAAGFFSYEWCKEKCKKLQN